MPTTGRKLPPVISADEMRHHAGEAMSVHFRMLKATRQAQGDTPEEFYGFRPEDVVSMHGFKHGFGRGLWYRLKEGRVFDGFGQPSERERHWYVSAKH